MAVAADASPSLARVRIQILLVARSEAKDLLARALSELAADAAVRLDPSITVSVLTEIPDDAFPQFNPGVRPMDAVLDVDGPATILSSDYATA